MSDPGLTDELLGPSESGVSCYVVAAGHTVPFPILPEKGPSEQQCWQNNLLDSCSVEGKTVSRM